MHHKLNFLRNPRYQLPPAVKLLQSQFQPAPAWGVGGTSPTRQEPTGPPIKSNMTARPDVIFVVEPEEVSGSCCLPLLRHATLCPGALAAEGCIGRVGVSHSARARRG